MKKHSIVAVNPDGSVAGFFEYIKDAVDRYGMDRHSITDSCKRGTICRGLKWFYEEDYRQIYMKCEFEKLRYKLDPNRDRKTYHFKKGHKFVGKLSEKGLQKKRERMINVAAMRKQRGDYELMSEKRKKPLRCVNDGMCFDSRKEASQYYNIPQHQICAAITRNGIVHGLKFETL